MFYKKFLLCSCLLFMFFCVGVVNASDIDNVTEIEMDNGFVENICGEQIVIADDYLSSNQNIELGTNSDYCSLIICDENYTIIDGFTNNYSSNLPSYYLNNNIYSHIEN
ncbi:hypothetical protein [Methanobrevibacter sp.]|uniref:hypothetical protein n=1 Tax=Methanobrevibacter sp. TaxID=66852 RepID=UPI00388F8159